MSLITLFLGIIIGAIISRSRDLYKEGRATQGFILTFLGKLWSSIDQLILFGGTGEQGEKNLWNESKIKNNRNHDIKNITFVSFPNFFPIWFAFSPIILWFGILSAIIYSLDGFMVILGIIFYTILLFGGSAYWTAMLGMDFPDNKKYIFSDDNFIFALYPYHEDASVKITDINSISCNSGYIYLKFKILNKIKIPCYKIYLRTKNENILLSVVSSYLDDQWGGSSKKLANKLSDALKSHRAKIDLIRKN